MGYGLGECAYISLPVPRKIEVSVGLTGKMLLRINREEVYKPPGEGGLCYGNRRKLAAIVED
jgi:hypothetical protein